MHVFCAWPQLCDLVGKRDLDGVPAEPQDELAAYDSQGVCLGKANVIASEGLSFFSLVYGDDPTTVEDEGMTEGDSFVLEFHDVSNGDVMLHSAGASFTGGPTPTVPPAGWTDLTRP